jgi:type II secretory pathway pseudopilin PulG
VKKCAAQVRESLHDVANATRPCPRPGEKGYVLLTLLLLVALMAVVAMGVIIPIQAEYQREQETEMIHRGVQYSRAIKNYYKKFSRYPTKLDDLDNTNNMRYLRKHYKDPLNCKNGKCQDFRLLHYGEPGVTLGGGFSIGGGSIPGASAVGSPAGQSSFGGSSSSFGNSGSGSSFGNSAFGGSGSSSSGFGNSGFGNSGVNSSGVFSQSSGSGGNSNGGFGPSSNSQTGTGQQGTDQQGTGLQGTNSAPGSDSSQASQTPGGQGDPNAGGQQLVASGPIVGVASLCKKTTIREYNHKKKYNEWQFLYDPSLDRGGIITTPYQPGLQSLGFGPQQNLNGAQPAAGTNSSPFGNSNGSSFGNSNGSSFGQSSSFGNSGSSSSPSQPPANPPQQQ